MGKEYRRDLYGIVASEPALSIVYDDDIEDTLKWTGSGHGADWTVEKSTAMVFEKTYSLHLKTRATAPAAYDVVYANRLVFLPTLDVIKFSVYFNLVNHTYTAGFVISLMNYNGTKALQSSIRYSPGSPAFEILNSAGAYETITELSKKAHQDAWHHISFAANFTTKKYLSATLDNNHLDFTNQSIRETDSATEPHLNSYLMLTAGAAHQAEAYFDRPTLYST